MARDQDYARRYASTVPLSAPKWCERFIGIPYKDNGHGFDGANCWGIVYLVLKHHCGIEVDPGSDVSADDVDCASSTLLHGASRAPWSEVAEAEAKAFDCVLLRGQPLHTGIIVAPSLMLHVWHSPASMVMHLDNPRIRARLLGFYRHSALT